jgi:hypothetical protein
MTRSHLLGFLAALVAATVFATPASAVHTLNVTSSYNPALDVIEWEFMITQNGTGSMATNMPLTLVPDTAGFNVDLRANSSASETTHGRGPLGVPAGATDANLLGNETWYYNETAAGSGVLLWNTQQLAGDQEQNLGFNPFTDPANQQTEGLWLDTANDRLFAALGSDKNMPDGDGGVAGTQIRTLHIASNDGILNWTNLRVAEMGASDFLTGFKSSIRKGDMNGVGGGSGVNFGDLAGFGQILTGQLPAYEATNPGLDGIARADMNNSGAANFGDLFAFGNCLTNGVCPPMEMGGAGAGGGGLEGASAVPEPATIALLALASLSIVALVRRR